MTTTALAAETGAAGPAGAAGTARSLALPGTARAAADARRFIRATLTDWAARRSPGAEGLDGRVTDEAVLLVSELVTNAVVHAGTDVDVHCRLDADGPGGLVVEVADRHPTRPVCGPHHGELPGGGGHGLQLVGAVAASWGITYDRAAKAVWFRLATAAPDPGPDRAPGHVPAARTAPDDAPAAYRGADGPDGPPEGAYRPAPGRDPADTGGAYPDTEAPAAGRPAAGYADAAYGAGSYSDTSYGYAAPDGGPSGAAAEWITHGAPTFLAEASDLLSGPLDADRIASLAAQLAVPRLADWCAVWLYDGEAGGPVPGTAGGDEPPRLAHVWHSRESRIDPLRLALEKAPPPATARATDGSAIPWAWPEGAGGAHPGAPALPEGAGEPDGPGESIAPDAEAVPDARPAIGGAALACPLISGGLRLGTVLLGRAGLPRFPDAAVGLSEDLCRRVARAVATARAYSRQERISRVLQRRLLPHGRARVPGVASAVVYEPRAGAWAGGDFWDLFDAGDGRWCFALGDVCGSGPEAAAVTGLARPVLRLLARDGFGVGAVLDRLNETMAREAADSVAAVAAAVAAEAGVQSAVGLRDEGEQARFLSLLYGEIVPHPEGSGGVRCTLASAGHPLPLVLGTDGMVRVIAVPQMLLGVVGDATYESEAFDLAPGETLLCVTDGVTERRSGRNQFDDDDGLARTLAACAGLPATDIAEHIRRAVHGFSPTPPDDDLALLVLQALPEGRTEGEAE
ncbi:SpoIIE family protein phosphatase [Streptomyces benahoarensis]|uniref:SpoIIE family protein phosphatase n=1 Tax=Streptomyces benahoarensis TaxID=2595054 RepID=A0A553Z4M4_9ACTN|nr:SpoIIE family protein phosphatase [Streptomyces benahoarensis]TSB18851.1 SpoIIE family protein phosphatase [Streptomyces benahoarensis]TSB36420.1 SpoIIE family protein phosphatase [Streptomyces benahoarensis]